MSKYIIFSIVLLGAFLISFNGIILLFEESLLGWILIALASFLIRLLFTTFNQIK